MSNRFYNREQEIHEAIAAGERALGSLYSARDQLQSARNWGFLDMFGGNMISGMLKHSKIDNARRDIEDAKRDLEAFRNELADIQDMRFLQVDIGGFLTFADFFFDGFIADVFVQSKIREAQDNVAEATRRVEDILRELRRYEGKN